MLEFQNTILDWFGQFTSNVYIVGDEYGLDPITLEPKIKPMPLISVGYSTSDFAENTMMTFNIWTHSVNWIDVLSIEERIAKALPHGGISLDIKSGSTFEYFNPGTGLWTEFDLADAAQIAQDIMNRYGEELDWRETPGEVRGSLWLMRGNPFTYSVPDVDFMIKRRSGNIIIRNYTLY